MGAVILTREMTRSRRQARIAFFLLVALGIAIVVTGFPLRSLSSQQADIASMSARLDEIQATNRALASEVAQLRNPGTAKQLAIEYLGLNPSSSSVNRAPVVSGSPGGHLIHSVPLSAPPVLPGSPLSNALLGLPGAANALASSGAPASHAPASGAEGRPVRHSADQGSQKASHGFLHRLISALEFWR